jgi:hypothetical protein
MKLLAAILVWALMAVVIGAGMLLAVTKGTPWLLVLALAGFVVAVGKIGCATH